QLRAEDVDRKAHPDAPHGRICKRGEVDKEGWEMWVPSSEDARQALDRLPVLRGWLFPAPRNVQDRDARQPRTARGQRLPCVPPEVGDGTEASARCGCDGGR